MYIYISEITLNIGTVIKQNNIMVCIMHVPICTVGKQYIFIIWPIMGLGRDVAKMLISLAERELLLAAISQAWVVGVNREWVAEAKNARKKRPLLPFPLSLPLSLILHLPQRLKFP